MLLIFHESWTVCKVGGVWLGGACGRRPGALPWMLFRNENYFGSWKSRKKAATNRAMNSRSQKANGFHMNGIPAIAQ